MMRHYLKKLPLYLEYLTSQSKYYLMAARFVISLITYTENLLDRFIKKYIYIHNLPLIFLLSFAKKQMIKHYFYFP